MLVRMLVVTLAVGLLGTTSCAMLHQSPRSVDPSTPAPWASLEPTQRNQAAQAYYNQERADALRDKQARSPFYHFIEDDAVGYGAFFGGLLAIVSLVTGVRSARRQQRDTQVYEAARRLGDKDSPALRASAAELVYVLARPQPVANFLIKHLLVRLSESLHLTLWWLSEDYYLGTTQLVTALAMESDANVVARLSTAVKDLVHLAPAYVHGRLVESETDADLIESIGTCLAERPSDDVEAVTLAIEKLLAMRDGSLKDYIDKRTARYNSSIVQFRAAKEESKERMRQRAFAAIRAAGRRRVAFNSLIEMSEHAAARRGQRLALQEPSPSASGSTS